MPIHITPPVDDAARQAVVIAAPRVSDAISGALRCAYGIKNDADDFATLLRQIDIADRESANF